MPTAKPIRTSSLLNPGQTTRSQQALASQGHTTQRAAIYASTGTYAPVPGPFTPQTSAWLAARATHRSELALREEVVGPLTSTHSLSSMRAAASAARARTLKGAGY